MKAFEGEVISTKMAKAAVILLERKYRHPLYGKIVTRKAKIHAQNQIGAQEGQKVRIVQTRPISKTISFKISEILEAKNEKSPPKEIKVEVAAEKPVKKIAKKRIQKKAEVKEK